MDTASPKNNYYYNPSLKQLARKLRRNSTKAEQKLWEDLLSDRQYLGYHFYRQRPVFRFIADFMCKELKLIIEVDGITHLTEEQQIKDQDRDQILKHLGFTTLRFSDWEILNELGKVDEQIYSWIQKSETNL